MQAPRSHKLLDRAPLLGSLLLTALLWQVFLLGRTGISAVISLILPGFPYAGAVSILLTALLVHALYQRWFHPQFRGMLQTMNLRLELLLCLPAAIQILLSCLAYRTFFHVHPVPLTPQSVETAFTAGFGEELLFRGVLLSTLMRQRRQEAQILPAAATSAVLFGLLHGANLLAGADWKSTILQVLNAAFLGIFFAAVFLRSGSLWPAILSHLSMDLFFLTDEAQNTAVLSSGIRPQYLLDVTLSLLLCLLGLWLLRGERRVEILRLWKEKWESSSPSRTPNPNH